MNRAISRISTSTLIALAFTAPAVLIAAVLVGHDALLARQRLRADGIRYGQILAEPILGAWERASRQGSIVAVQELLDDAGRSRWARHLVLAGGDGRVLASSRRDWIGLEESSIGGTEDAEAAAAARSSRQPQHRLFDDGRRMLLVWPVFSGGSGTVRSSAADGGLLYVEMDLDGRRRELEAHVVKRGVFSVLGVLGFSLCLHLCVRTILTSRIQEAARYARAVARGEEGRPPRVLWPREVAQLVHDVGRIGSDRRDREAALRAAEEKVLKARRLETITSRARDMARDLNNQLTGVLGYARLALDRVGEGDPIRRLLATIENCATRAADLTGRLLILDLPAAGPTGPAGPSGSAGATTPAGPTALPDAGGARAAGFGSDPAGPGAALPDGKEGAATVLAVDDESTVLALAKDVLEMHGHKVLTARNGEEALRVFRARREEIDLVLLDLTMPVMGGRECFREMRRIDPRVRVVISSGFSSEGSAGDILGEGAIDFLPKPYDIDSLARAVAAALDRPAPRAAAGASGRGVIVKDER